MKSSDISRPLTAHALNENMFKQFKVKIDFDKYSREQLEDYRNLLRTKVSQLESGANFNDLLTNETYQRDKYMLGVLNTRIKEMLGESKILAEKAKSKAQQKFMGMVHAAQKGEKPASKEVAKAAKGMSKKAAKDFAKTKHKGLPAHVDETFDEPAAPDPVAIAKKKAREALARRRDKEENDVEYGWDVKEKPSAKAPANRKVAGTRYGGSKQKDDAVDEASTVQDFVAKGGKITYGKYHEPRKGEKWQGSAHIGKGDARGKAGQQTGRGANVGKKGVSGKPVVTAETAKPDFLDMDKDGNKREPMKKAVADKKKNPFKKTTEGYTNFGAVYAEQLAQKMFDMNPDFPTKGKADELINAAWPVAVKDLGKKRAQWEFGYDEDFISDFVTAYAWLQRGDEQVAEAKKSKPDFLDMDKDGNKKETMKKAVKDKASKTKVKESMDKSELMHRAYQKFISEGIANYIAEDEEGKAKSITAAADMVNDFTSLMQRVGNYQTKSMIELADNIRANFGMQEAEQFKQSVGAALEEALNALTAAREQINNAVAVLAGEAPAQEPMGMEPGAEAPGEFEMPQAGPDEMNAGGDEFAAADAAAGGPETTGRVRRESIERGNRLMRILGS